MQSLDKDLIKESLILDDIRAILRDLGSEEPILDDKGNLIAQTICHHGSKFKLYYYPDSRMFHCYTDCGDSFDIYELVIRSKRSVGITISFPQAVRYVANISNLLLFENDELEQFKEQKIDDWGWLSKFTQKEKKFRNPGAISENILEMFCYRPHELWIKDNISPESMKKFEISYWGKENKIIIPHRDICGDLIGIRGRNLNEEELAAGRKYMPITVEGKTLKHNLGDTLYGLYQNKDAIVRSGRLFLVESEKSVLQIETMYPDYNYALAVCGSNLTDHQCEIIKSLGVDRCYIAFDKEYIDHKSKRALLYYEKLCKLAEKLNPYMSVYLIMDRQNLLQEKDSPSDRGKEIFEKLLDDKIEVKPKERKE